MKVFRIVSCLALLALTTRANAQTLINSFETSAEVQSIQTSSAQVSQITQNATQGSYSLRTDFLPSAWPKITIPCPGGQSWNWGNTAGLAVDVTNPGDARVILIFRVEDAANLSGNATGDFRSGHCTLEPHETETFLLPYVDSLKSVNYGVVNMPYEGMNTAQAMTGNNPFSAAHIYDYSFTLQNVTATTTLYFDNVRTVAPVSTNGMADKYGQSSLSTWTGKAKLDTDLTTQFATEQADLGLHPGPTGRDGYGGWGDGPAMTATGYFSTTRYQNKWWLVTPAGHLFFGLGMDSVRSINPTFTTSRESMFQWLPSSSDPLYAFYDTFSGAVGGPITSGTTYDFYLANLQRKYGADYYNQWVSLFDTRAQSWGFNVIGDDSDSSTYDHGTAATVLIEPAGSFALIPSGSGHGDPLPDPWDPNYKTALDNTLAQQIPSYKGDPYILGYYVNNELSFAGNGTDGNEALPIAVLAASQANSPAKQAFLAKLQSEYTTVGALNTAWGTNFTSWSAMAPGFNVTAPTQACLADLDGFTLAIARQYFQTVKAELGKYDPSHLYLGCRFSYNYLVPQALQACAESADVISLNIYEPRLNAAEWGFLSQYDKPVIVGEFHMGALDRGSFSPGLVAAPSQAARASMFTDYVQSALSSPSLVGVDWYQYMDQPCTGTANDGENGNIGFVSITDNPYPEMVGAARAVSQNLYTFRAHSNVIAVGSKTAQSGASVTLNATLTRVADGSPIQGKTLKFSIDGIVVGAATTYSTGTAYADYTIPASAAAGAPVVTVTFAGDTDDSPVIGSGTLTVTPIPTFIRVKNISAATGVSAKLSATLLDSASQTPLPNQKLTFTVNGAKAGTAVTDANGIGYSNYAVPLNAVIGSQTVEIAYAGDASNSPSTGTGALKVGAGPTAIAVQSLSGDAGATVTLSATLKRTDSNMSVQGRNLAFSVNGVNIGTAPTYSTGQAYVSYKIPASAAAGAETISVAFAGDSADAASTGKGTLTVQDLPTAVAVKSVSGSAGHMVSLSATLTRTDTKAALMGKKLTFSLGGVKVGSGTTYSTGIVYVNYNVPTGSSGKKTITVSFAGDASDKSSSGTGTLTIP